MPQRPLTEQQRAVREEQGRIYAALRRRKGLKQAGLAAAVDVSQAMLSQIERGARTVPRFRAWRDYDESLALGDEQPGDELRYVLGYITEADTLRLLDRRHGPPRQFTIFEDPGQADAEAGRSGLGVVPVWASYLQHRK